MSARSSGYTVAIVADVHGNLASLEAVTSDLREQQPDEVVVNGDLVNRGPEGVEVLDLLADLADDDVAITLGNHEDLMSMWVARDPSLPQAWFDDPFWSGAEWCARQLVQADRLGSFASWPMTHAVTRPGAPSVLVAHGSPRHYREGIGRHLSDDAVHEIASDHPFDVFVGSHTHQPFHREVGSHLVVNSGAVGSPFNRDPRAQYLLLHWDGVADRWDVDFRRVPYDRDRALDAYRRSGYLDEGGLSAAIFQLEVVTARSWLMPFMVWSDRHARPYDPPSWHAFVAERGGLGVSPDGVGQSIVDHMERVR